MKDTATRAREAHMKKMKRDLPQLVFWLSVGFVAGLVTATAARASDVTWEAMPENGRQVAAISDGARIWAGNYACVMHNPSGAPDIDTDALLEYLIWSVTERTNLRLDYRGETTATVVDGCIVIQWQTLLEMWTERGSLAVKGFTAVRYYATTNAMVSARVVLQSNDFRGDYRLATHTAMHEMGHAIGIAGHSPHEHDVMHATRKHGISLKVPGLMSRRIRETHPSRREPQSAMKIDINKLWKPVSINMNEYERDFGGQS